MYSNRRLLLAKCSRSLVFNDEVATALQQACELDFDNEAMTLLKATRIIHRDLLDTKSKFNGTFKNSCQQESVQESLKTLIGMIFGGTRYQDPVKR